MISMLHKLPRLSRKRAALVALLLAPLIGCSTKESSTSPSLVLLVAAASDLQSALPELIREFRHQSPSLEIQPTFGSSGQIAEQIKAGAPYDLFLAANEAYVRDLATEHYIDAPSIRPYAIGALVLAVNREVREPVDSLTDLTRPALKKVAIANPDLAPYGAAAKRALTRAGLWEKLQPKMVLADSVRQALLFVQTGNAEAGFVSRAMSNVAELRTLEIDPSLYDPIVQTLGIVSATKKRDAAESFARFLTSPQGQKLLISHGFKATPAETGP